MPGQSNSRQLRREEVMKRISDVQLGGATAKRIPYGISITLRSPEASNINKASTENGFRKAEALKTVELFSWSQVFQ